MTAVRFKILQSGNDRDCASRVLLVSVRTRRILATYCNPNHPFTGLSRSRRPAQNEGQSKYSGRAELAISVVSSTIPDRIHGTSTGVALQRKSLSLAGFDLSVGG